MKKTIVIILFFLIAFTSCQKSGIPLFRGDYTFKTSGNVTVKRADLLNPAVFNVNLDNEIGQINIAKLDGKSDSLVVVMNYLNGEVIVTHGYCKGQEIFIKKFKRNALKLSFEGYLNLGCEVEVTAKGTMHDENTLILDMVYEGETFIMTNLVYDVYGDDIKMVANRN